MESFIPWIGIVAYGLPILIIGLYWKISPPKEINHIYGYRTRRSMKNQDVWDYANKIGAQAMIYAGIITTISGLIPLFIGWKHAHFIPLFVLLISILGTMLYCEKQLDQHFDKDGNPK